MLRSDTVYLSYFNNRKVRELPEWQKYSIARYANYFNGLQAVELLVPRDVFNAYRSNKLDLQGLKNVYYELVLKKLDREDVFDNYSGKVLLCHEVRGCHREEVKIWLNEGGFNCEEL